MLFNAILTIFNIFLIIIIGILPDWGLPDILIDQFINIKAIIIGSNSILPIKEAFICLSIFMAFKTGLLINKLLLGNRAITH